MNDVVDAINGYVFSLITLALLAPMILLHSIRMFFTKTPPQDDDLPEN